MKKTLFIIALFSLVFIGFHYANAQGRFKSIRVGGYTSHGKGSHYVGGFKRFWR